MVSEMAEKQQHCMWTLILVITALLVPQSQAQFPRVCANNASTSHSVCCPSPPGMVQPCGGTGWGRCVSVRPGTTSIRQVHESVLDDPRIDWPRRYFGWVCQCEGNRMGYACHECKFGWQGKTCDIPKKPVVRKNALTLTAREKEKFIEAVLSMKNTKSDYVVLRNGFGLNSDDPERFVDVTVYDCFTVLHCFASKSAMVNGKPVCEIKDNSTSLHSYNLDFAHLSSGFPSWHRLFLLLWESELQKISGDPTMAIPYWDWSDHKTNCSVCTNDLMGSMNNSDPSGKLHADSAFTNWKVVVERTDQTCGANTCVVSSSGEFLRRQPSGRCPALPAIGPVKYALSRSSFDSAPFNERTPKTSFRGCLEGSVGSEGIVDGTDRVQMHSQGHVFFEGHISEVPRSPSDPLFYLHHSYVDKVLEAWTRMKDENFYNYPQDGAAPAGHNLHDAMVPFFPLYRHVDFLKDSRSLGYDFDKMEEITWMSDEWDREIQALGIKAARGSGIMVVVTIVVIACVAAAVVSLVLLLIIRNRSAQGTYEEKQNLLPNANTM